MQRQSRANSDERKHGDRLLLLSEEWQKLLRNSSQQKLEIKSCQHLIEGLQRSFCREERQYLSSSPFTKPEALSRKNMRT